MILLGSLADSGQKTSGLKMLRQLCHFRELPYGVCGSLHDAMRGKEYPEREKVVSYLDAGVVCAMAPGLVCNVISGEVIGPLVMKTDGVWIWGSDLSVYVAKYNIAPPADFLDLVRSWKGTPFDVDLDVISV